MPARVRFVDVPATPSSTYSGATLASSPGPMTPPVLVPSPLPTKSYFASPVFSAGSPLPRPQVQINNCLAHLPGVGALLHWDLTQECQTAQLRVADGWSSLPSELLAMPATTPKLGSLTIVCDGFPWAITVLPWKDAAWSPAPYVTVGDVLYSVYRALRREVTPAEEKEIRGTGFEKCVQAAYERRWQHIADPNRRMEEYKKGVKRVDFLCQKRMFQGLSVVPEGLPAMNLPPGVVWRLNVSAPVARR
ncbi:hypothetical protein BN946_scf184844.g34 [Trametes cinnabarina]|uniref:DUF6699 domain-containing protein n=1 Tax=Pycnoporus cinnabarinus TaxID=5643 RepID=A0A060S9K3_PYCCI|nr:hypothetical protein BN946_scf184844.g34 [Trametes cinnabarina]